MCQLNPDTTEYKWDFIMHLKRSSLGQHSKALSQPSSIICMMLFPLISLHLSCLLPFLSVLPAVKIRPHRPNLSVDWTAAAHLRGLCYTWAVFNMLKRDTVNNSTTCRQSCPGAAGEPCWGSCSLLLTCSLFPSVVCCTVCSSFRVGLFSLKWKSQPYRCPLTSEKSTHF